MGVQRVGGVLETVFGNRVGAWPWQERCRSESAYYPDLVAASLACLLNVQAAHHAATAAQLGGDALVVECQRLQADLLNCQQALLDKEAESLEKERRLAEMAARWVRQPAPSLHSTCSALARHLPRAAGSAAAAPAGWHSASCVLTASPADPQAGLSGALCTRVRLARQVCADRRPARGGRLPAVPLTPGGLATSASGCSLPAQRCSKRLLLTRGDAFRPHCQRLCFPALLDLCSTALSPSAVCCVQSSGLEMLQAHALIPEGAGGGSVYRRPRAPPGPPVPDTSYTLPSGTPLAAAAAAPGVGRSPLVAAAAAPAVAAAAGAPVSGSDMELTGPIAVEQQQQQQQAALQHQAVQQCDQGLQTEPEQQQVQQAPLQRAQRRQSLQPAAGRMAHAAAGPAPRPASAESQLQLPPRQQQQQRRRASVAPAPSGAVAAAAAAATAGEGASRRMSAPPAPVDRELHFTSASTAEGRAQHALAAVPEETPLAADGQADGPEQQEQQQQQPAAQGAGGIQPPPFEFPQMPEPAASELTAPAARAAGRAGVPTPGSVPAPPRHLAITALTGLAATPVKGGIFQYHDPRSGFTFELGPAPPDSTGAACRLRQRLAGAGHAYHWLARAELLPT